MATTYESLIAAGAPELPGSLFYRVKLTEDATIRVEVRQPNPYFGSRRLVSRFVSVQVGRPALPQVIAAAKSAAEAVRIGADVLTLTGDYRK